jgi:formamidopyrimidine-DNA glycosylase
MPELPDVEVYVEALRQRVLGEPIQKLRLFSPFVLRTVEPRPDELVDRHVQEVSRLGKRIVLELEGDLYMVIHLMIAGRLRWSTGEVPKSGGKIGMAAIVFPNAHVTLTEASSKKRASLHILQGREALAEHDRGGLEPLDCSFDQFKEALLSESRTLKRALTNPRAFSGIGNAYSDEILHAARLSPLRLTRSLDAPEIKRLHQACRETLALWKDRLLAQFKNKFPGPGEITAFRPDFAAHGKFGQPCPECGKPIQRIRYAQNETNYCAQCQNEGRLLADRSLSRLLKDDWPKTLEELEQE